MILASLSFRMQEMGPVLELSVYLCTITSAQQHPALCVCVCVCVCICVYMLDRDFLSQCLCVV